MVPTSLLTQVLGSQFLFSPFIRHCASLSSLGERRVGVIGAPFGKGQRAAGVELGPNALRVAGLVPHLRLIGCDVKDYGDVPWSLSRSSGSSYESMVNERDVAAFNERLSRYVTRTVNDGRMCLTLGGDHSIGIGTLHGHLKAQPETSVLWVDAHADINTPASSMSGNAHGMPLSFSIKELDKDFAKPSVMKWHTPLLSAKHLAFIGLRDVDPAERAFIEKLGICALSMEEVHDMGMKEAVRYALNRIDPENKRFLHVSFDIDALDPLEAPCTGTPVRGGITLREGIEFMRKIQQTGRLSGLDIAEVNPLLGSSRDCQLTLDAVRHLVAAAAGYSYLRGRAFRRPETYVGEEL